VAAAGRTSLTAEVVQALDFLPRAAFMGEILRAAHGAAAARTTAAAEVELATVSIVIPHSVRGLRTGLGPYAQVPDSARSSRAPIRRRGLLLSPADRGVDDDCGKNHEEQHQLEAQKTLPAGQGCVRAEQAGDKGRNE